MPHRPPTRHDRLSQMRSYFYSRKVSVLSTEIVKANWPIDVPFNEEVCRAIQCEWVKLKMNEPECVWTFIRNRVPTEHKGEMAIPMPTRVSTLDISSASVGPFSYGTGGGVRNIRKANGMS